MTRTIVRRENDLLSQLVSSYPDRLLGFCGVDPLQPFSPEEIRRCREELGLHGVKLHLQGNRVDLANPDHLKSLKEVLVLAAALRMPVLIHNNASSFDNGRPYAERFIQDLLSELDPITILFAHTGGGGLYFDFTHEFLEVFAQYFREKSSRRHQIYFELSGTVSGTDYPGERSMDELAAMIMEIGPERFLFGSDYPYRVSSSYIKEITRELKLDPQILKQIIERDIFEELKK